MKKTLLVSLVVLSLSFAGASSAMADPSSNGPGQPGAPNVVCGDSNPMTPGGSASAKGSPFNANGTSGTVYAGNPGTASLAHANSTHAVSQYDVACFQQSH